MKTLVISTTIISMAYLTYSNLHLLDAQIGRRKNKRIAKFSNIESSFKVTYLGDSLVSGINSDGLLHADNDGFRTEIRDIVARNNIMVEETCFAFPGYQMHHVIADIANNISLNDINQQIRSAPFYENASPMNKYNNVGDDKNITIQQSIINSDYVIINCGANDILQILEIDREKGNLGIPPIRLLKKIKEIKVNKLKLYSNLQKLNPNLKIFDIGLYFAFPYISHELYKVIYPVLMFAQKQILVSHPKQNIFAVPV